MADDLSEDDFKAIFDDPKMLAWVRIHAPTLHWRCMATIIQAIQSYNALVKAEPLGDHRRTKHVNAIAARAALTKLEAIPTDVLLEDGDDAARERLLGPSREIVKLLER